MKHLLVLCIGNICRSPMAERMLKRALPDHVVRSAGLSALIGKPAEPFAVQLMQEQGIDINEHRAQQISASLVAQAELILVMDAEQKRYIETNYVGTRGKVFLLAQASKADIPDPYGEGLESFRTAYRMIEEGVQFWAQQIGRVT